MIKNQLNFYFPSLAIVCIIYLILTSLLLYKNSFDFSKFIDIGDKFIAKDKLLKNISYSKASEGYDGEFYYRLALNPFTSKISDYGIILDVPSYRHQRIMYPILVWIFSLGKSELIPFMLFFINFIAILVLTLLGSYLAKLLNLNPIWGITFALFPGFIYSFSSDLAEIVQALFLLSGIILLKKSKYFYGATFFSLATLTRESSLIIPISLFIFSAKRKYMLIPITVFATFQFILLSVWGEFPFSSKASAFTLPFFGLVSFLTNILSGPNFPRIFFLQIGFLFTLALSVLIALKSAKIEKYIKLSFLLYTALALCFSTLIWVEDKAFLRSLNEFYFLGIIILLSSKFKFKKYIFGFTLIVFLATFFHII